MDSSTSTSPDVNPHTDTDTDDYLRPYSREIGITKIVTDEVDVMGLTYHTDFRTEEEHGAVLLRAAFAAASAQGTLQHDLAQLEDTPHGKYTQDQLIEVGTDYLALIIEPKNHYHERQISQARSYLTESTPRVRTNTSRWEYERKTIPELREMARQQKVVIPSRAKKAEMVTTLAAAAPVDRPTIYPAWLHYGDMLVLPRGTGDRFDQIVDTLISAAHAGTLVVGGIGPAVFTSGVTLFDERDLDQASKEQVIDHKIWYLDRMAELAPIEAELTARGHCFIFLGNPDTRSIDGHAAVRYWLNGFSSGRHELDYPQPFGWYTLEELLAEKFVSDARERKARLAG